MGQPQLIEEPSAGDNPRAHWPEELQAEFDQAGSNGIHMVKRGDGTTTGVCRM